jgi:hypothetical protein
MDPVSGRPAPGADVTPAAVPGRLWGYGGAGDWLGEAPAVDAIDEEMDFDVVVIGSGNAGVQAALAAAENGASVAVLEKLPDDGFHWYGEDFAAYNSRIQQDLGIGPYDVGEIVDEFVTRSGGRANPEIIRLYVANSGATLDHMLDVAKEMGADPRVYTHDGSTDGWMILHVNMDYDKYLATGDVAASINKRYPMVNGKLKTWAGAVQFMGPYIDEPIQGCSANSVLPLLQQASLEKAMQLGAQWFMGTPAVVLVQNESKEVTGVIAKDTETGRYIKFNARRGVVAAGGDFGANSQMSWALLGEFMERRERSGGREEQFRSIIGGQDGSCIKMLCWAGGYVEPSPRSAMAGGGGPSGPWGTSGMLWLNKDGQRFVNEANPLSASAACALQPKGPGCIVTDRKWLKSVCASGVEHGGPNAGRPQYFTDIIDGMAAIKPGPDGGLVKVGTIAERGYIKVFAAETIDALLGYLGYGGEAAAAAQEAIRRYNVMCRKGADGDYGKDPSLMVPVDEAPYYGISAMFGDDSRLGPGLVTVAGVVADRRLRVVDINKRPIKGLYVCGNSLGGRYGIGYSTPTAGNSIGMACTHGRIAGRNASEGA